MRVVPKPDKSTPLLGPDGKHISDVWDEYFAFISARGLGLLSDVSATAPTNGQVLVWVTATGKWTPAAN
jgi:hypothetical protein